MSAPNAVRVTGDELEHAPQSYGHLIMLAARHAWQKLDGTSVVNHQSGLHIAFTWPRGLKGVVTPGTPEPLLLAIPALPRLLEGARYLGAFPDPQHRPDVKEVRAFAASLDVAGTPLEVRIAVREDRQGRCFFDRLLAESEPAAAHASDSGASLAAAEAAPPARGEAGDAAPQAQEHRQ